MADKLISILKDVTGSEIQEDVANAIRAELLDEESFVELTEDELKDIGFKLGQRKKILGWMAGLKMRTSAPSTPVASISMSVATPSPTPLTPRSTSAATPTSGYTSFRNFAVDELLEKFTKSAVNGPGLVRSLKTGNFYSQKERCFFVKVIGRHLLQNCAIQFKPSKTEKMDMAQSIIDIFPVLKDPITGGYENFYNAKEYTGHLESYIRGRRHRDPEIPTLWKHSASRKLDLPLPLSSESEERVLRERRPNTQNRSELLSLMDKTRNDRRCWIQKEMPSITEIIRRYPRFLDVPDAVREEFNAIWATEASLTKEWLRYKVAVLNVAQDEPALHDIITEITCDLDEDNKSLVAFKALIYLLPPPPKRGVKRPRTDPAARVKEFFTEFEQSTVEVALQTLNDRPSSDYNKASKSANRRLAPVQPVLFRTQGQYFVKVDNMAIAVTDASCFAEAAEFLFMCFFVFWVEYPFELRQFYLFLEYILGIKSTASKSSAVSDLVGRLRPYLPAIE